MLRAFLWLTIDIWLHYDRLIMHSSHPDIWQRVHHGDWYQTQEPALKQAREHAKQLCWALNQLPQESNQQREPVIRQILPHVHQAVIGTAFACDYGQNVYCDDILRLGNRVVLLDATYIRFGRGVVVGDDCVLVALTHPLEATKRKAGWQQARPVIIGDNVRLGKGCTVLPGAVIAANSNIEPGSVITAHG